MILGRPSISPGKISLTSKGRPFHQQLGLLMYRRPTLPGWISPDLTFETLVCRISLQCFGLYSTLWNGRVSLPWFTRNSEDGCYNCLISRFEMPHGEWICYGIYIIIIIHLSHISYLNGFSDVVSSKGRSVTSWGRGGGSSSTSGKGAIEQKVGWIRVTLVVLLILANTQPPNILHVYNIYIYIIHASYLINSKLHKKHRNFSDKETKHRLSQGCGFHAFLLTIHFVGWFWLAGSTHIHSFIHSAPTGVHSRNPCAPHPRRVTRPAWGSFYSWNSWIWRRRSCGPVGISKRCPDRAATNHSWNLLLRKGVK